MATTKKISKKFAVIKRDTPVYKEPKKGKIIKKEPNPNDTKFYVATKQSGSYYYFAHYGGWINASNLKAETKAQKTKKDSQAKLDKINAQIGAVEAASYKAAINAMLKTDEKVSSTILDESTRLFGMPHRFNRFADMPISKTSQLGRNFAERFASEAPILALCPGRPNFMDNFRTSAERKSFLEAFTQGFDDAARTMNATINSMVKNKDFKYFNFYTDFTNYINYVNLMCRIGAVYLGIGDKKIIGKDGKQYVKYKSYNWKYYRYHLTERPNMKTTKTISKSVFDGINDKIKKPSKSFYNLLKDAVATDAQYIQFYLDPSTSYQETASNTTGQSMLQSTVADADEKMKEYSFIANALGGGAAEKLLKTGVSKINQDASQIGSDSVFKRLFGSATTVLEGASIYFPEIYKSSDFSRSYNATINLTSPYGDKESLYLNILVPLFHLMAFVLPKQNTANSYAAPFLVRASSKGLFSIDMGIVDSLTIEKVPGSMTQWGIPTEVKLSLSIKDIYPTMMMTSSYAPMLFWENSSFRQWIATLSGLEVTKPHVYEKTEAMSVILKGMVKDIPDVVESKIQDSVRNMWQNLSRGSI